MFSNNSFISIRQLKMLLMLDIFGKGITILPRKVVEIGGQNGWIVILLGIIFSLVCLVMINKVAKIYPNDSFVSYTSKILGKPLGIAISIGFIVKIIISISLEVRIFAETLNEFMLFNTPFFIISLSIILVCGYMASKGYEARGRMAELLIFIVFVPLAFVLLVTIFDVDFSNLQPFLKQINSQEILTGGVYSLFYFSGIEFIFLVYPYIKDKKNIQKASMNALVMIGFVITIISVVTIARFGKYDIVHQTFPVLEIMDTVDMPGSFIERQEVLIMTFWIIAIFMIVNAGIFFSSLMLKDIVKKSTHTKYIIFCMSIVYALSFIPSSISSAYKIMDTIYMTFGIFYLFILPLSLLLVSKIRKLRMYNIVIVLLCSSFLTGCFDKVELEERGLVLAIGIDKYDPKDKDYAPDDKPHKNNKYLVSISMPNVSEKTEDGSSNNINQAIKYAEALSIPDALTDINSYMSKTLYFGHTKVAVIGKDILADSELLKETLDLLEKNKEISRNLIIIGTQKKAKDVLEVIPDDEKMIGIYINDFYKNSKKNDPLAFRLDLEDIVQNLLATGDSVVPNINILENGVSLMGLLVLKDYELVGHLDEELTKGLLWLIDKEHVRSLSVPFEDMNIPLSISKSKIKNNFYEDNNKIICEVDISLSSDILQYKLSENNLLKKDKYDAIEDILANYLIKQISTSLDYIKMLNADVLGLSESIRKNNYSLYEKYNLAETNIYDNIEFKINCTPKISFPKSIN